MKMACRLARFHAAVSLSCLAAATATAQVATPPPPEQAPSTQTPPPPKQLRTAPPPGFEDVTDRVDTVFDLSFRGQRLGAFRAIADGSTITFEDPAAIVAALGDRIIPDQVISLLSGPLSLNEEFRCVPGQTVGCNFLPIDQSGVIVNRERFIAELFLSRSYLNDLAIVSTALGPPTSNDFALIQTANMSLAGGFNRGGLRYGGIFDTLASKGRTALVAQTVLTDRVGARMQEGYLQHLWTDRRVAVGLLPIVNTVTITNLRVLGGEFGSFFLTNRAGFDPGTPIEILLPRRAVVEVYRNGVLLLTQVYEAGIQRVDTSRLPAGSYPVQLVARDGPAILLEETRYYTRINTLPPPGKVGFNFRAGERVDDLVFDILGPGATQSFFPQRSGELIVSAGAEMRVGRSIGIGAQLFSIGSDIFGEASVQLFRGRFSGLAAVSAGTEGSYAVAAAGTLQLPNINFSIDARSIRTDDDRRLSERGRFQPFFRSEDTLTGAASFRLLDGSATLSGSYSQTDLFGDQYALGARYSRAIEIRGVGRAQLAVSGTVSNLENRFLITLTHFRQIGRGNTLAATVGAEAITGSRIDGRNSYAPVVEASLTRIDRFADIDVVGQVGASTGADSNLVYGSVQAGSNRGTIDARVQYESGGGSGGASGNYIVNAQTGFAFGGGAFQLGLRNPERSMVMVDIEPDDVVTSNGQVFTGPTVAAGGYQVVVNNRDAGFVQPRTRLVAGLPPLDDYDVALRPEGAPQFDLDRTSERVTLYPGNVVRLRFGSRRLVSMFGQALDASGAAIASGTVTAGDDFTVTDANGYFTITAPVDGEMTIRRPDGSSCRPVAVANVAGGQEKSTIARIGAVRCQ